jgi:hypothetical protein
MSDNDQQLPPAAVIVQHSVDDWDAWKAAFDQSEDARRSASALGHHINRGENDPNAIDVYMAVGDVDQAKAFLGSDDLREEMKGGGVQGIPEVTWMKPLRESLVWGRELPAFMISHTVADLEAWLVGFDAASELQEANGIIGVAANCVLDDPSTVVVYHQAESFDTLRDFLALAELKAAMGEAGVTSEPDVSFHTGGWAKVY